MARWYEKLEKETGKPAEELLQNAFWRFGKASDVADYFGVSSGTISDALRVLGLRQHSILLPKGEQQDSPRCEQGAQS